MISTWSAIVPAVAALLGVALGQFWQGRRDEKRWEREHALERERHADQRARDQEIWSREDRARFVDKKREIYADYQTLAYRVSTTIVEADKAFRKAGAAEPARGVDRRSFFQEYGFPEAFGRAVDELQLVRNHIRLVAPATVAKSLTHVDEALNPTARVIMDGDSALVRELWLDIRRARFELLDAMRIDLDPESGPLRGSTEGNYVPDTVVAQWHDEGLRW